MVREEQQPPESERAKRARERVGDAYVDNRGPDGSGSRGYKWPPFEKGNTLQLRHGAVRSARLDALSAELAGGLLAERPDLERHDFAVAAWARAEGRCLLLAEWIGEHGLLDADGKATASERLLLGSERLAAQLRAELGLTPKAEAEVANAQADAAKNVVDLDALRARGREALKARREVGSGGHVREDVGRVRDGGGTP